MSRLADMIQILRVCRRIARLGIDPDTRRVAGSRPLHFLLEWRRFRALDRQRVIPARFSDLYPILGDSTEAAGDLGYYFHQDLWAARKIYAARPSRHIDVGSRIDGFVAHLLTFMPVEYVDIRPLANPVRGLEVLIADATRLEGLPDCSVPSLSSLSAAEHFGLGRYSDQLDPDACFKFMGSLCRVLAPGGRLYFAVPIGRERVEFNAHRIFGLGTILDRFRSLTLESFSYVDEADRFHEDVDPRALPSETESFAALFEFSRPSL